MVDPQHLGIKGWSVDLCWMDGWTLGNGCRMGKGGRKKRRRDGGLGGGWHVNGRWIDGQMDERMWYEQMNGSRTEVDKRRKEGGREGGEAGW